MKSNLQEFSLVLQVNPQPVESTAAALAVSVAGNPTKGNETLFRSWNATRNALEGYLSNNYGIPIVLMSFHLRHLEIPRVCYIPSLKVKVVNVQTFMEKLKRLRIGYFCHFNVRIQYFNDSAQNDGLRVRTIEINEQFTTNATNADNIKKL